MTNKLSLYFHIPFCIKKCDYCAFFSLTNQSDELKRDYFNALKSQLSFLDRSIEIPTVYFGGGTPPMLGIDRLCEIIALLKSSYNLTPDCEITVEVNPKTVSLSDLTALKSAGANRLSVGIQTASDSLLASIGRVHSFNDARACVQNARLAGFDNVSGDLIFALPDQDVFDLNLTLYEFLQLELDHISAYSLQLEEGTPLYARKKTITLPDEDEEESLYSLLWQTLVANGYEHYEISSFAKQGKRSRHNLVYWSRGEYLGLGAGAHSFYQGKRFSTPTDVDFYIKNAPLSLLAPTSSSVAQLVTPEEAEEERIMLGLRVSDGVIIPPEKHQAAARVASLGYGSFDGSTLALNSKGFRISNSIIGLIV